MSNYAKLTDFAIKDTLATGDPSKRVRGSEVDAEFEALETAIATKADLASPALTGNPTAPTQSVDNNSTRIATTAFVVAQIADDAPTKTGTGASGTWGISITGNAATATLATTATDADDSALWGGADYTVSTSAPSGGADGDFWFQRVA
jgi:hypothetical protein